MRRLLLDCDGVLGDMLERALEIINKLNGYATPKSSVTDWAFTKLLKDAKLDDAFWEEMNAPGFVYNINPFPEAQKAVAILKEYMQVTVVTSYSRSSQTWVYDRDRWLREHFNIYRSQIIHASRKHLIEGDIFVDDKMSNVLYWAEKHPYGKGVLWAHPYNEDAKISQCPNVVRMSSWDELIKLCESKT